ncbi:MAG: hypothetical protein GX434_07495 [Peptococcaceae bacterium]|nr:hypothetical protein [Peptococcaceae bacterium]
MDGIVDETANTITLTAEYLNNLTSANSPYTIYFIRSTNGAIYTETLTVDPQADAALDLYMPNLMLQVDGPDQFNITNPLKAQ